MNKNWDVNFGAVDRGTTGDFNSPSIASGEVVNLVDGGYNLYFEPGGDVTVTLDSLNATAVITGGNTPPQPQEDVWSIIGTINGNLSVKELLTLHSTSRVKGDILTNKLCIEPGAVFSGKCRMLDEVRGQQAEESEEKKD